MKTQLKMSLFGLSVLCFGLASNDVNAQRLRDLPPVPNFIKFEGHKTGDQPTYTERLKNIVFPNIGFFNLAQTSSSNAPTTGNNQSSSNKSIGWENHANDNRTRVNSKK
jgi:hypothetical protein